MSSPKPETIENVFGVVSLSDSECYRLLANKRRRLALDVLVDVGTPSTLTEVATKVAARERAETERPDADRPDVQIMLHHAHLPLLADAGVIDYKAEEHRIEAGRMSVDFLVE